MHQMGANDVNLELGLPLHTPHDVFLPASTHVHAASGRGDRIYQLLEGGNDAVDPNADFTASGAVSPNPDDPVATAATAVVIPVDMDINVAKDAKAKEEAAVIAALNAVIRAGETDAAAVAAAQEEERCAAVARQEAELCVREAIIASTVSAKAAAIQHAAEEAAGQATAGAWSLPLPSPPPCRPSCICILYLYLNIAGIDPFM